MSRISTFNEKLFRVGLTLILLAVALGSFGVQMASADVGVFDQWYKDAIIDVNPAVGAGAQTGEIGIGMGPERLLVVTIAIEYGATADSMLSTSPSNVTWGGIALTMIDDEVNNNQNNLWIGYLDEAGIASASGTTLSVTYNTSSATGGRRRMVAHAAVYQGVDQNDPIVDIAMNDNGAGNTSSLSFGSTVEVVEGGYIFYVANHSSGPSGTATPPSGGGYVEHFDENFINLAKSTSSKAVSSTGDEPNQVVTFGNSERIAIGVVSLRPSPAPMVVEDGVSSNEDTGDGILAEGEITKAAITEISITFDKDMANVLDPSPDDAVSNWKNYRLLTEGSVSGFQTIDCGKSAFDEVMDIASVDYDEESKTATLSFASPLPAGIYRLLACGTTTLRDLAGNALAGNGVNSGTDFVLNFEVAADPVVVVPEVLPDTGFVQGVQTVLAEQPKDLAYSSTNILLKLPTLGEEMSIVGVPMVGGEWNVNWLGNEAGWLNGSAYPTWKGNTVLTAHVWDANNHPGPFSNIKELAYGDQFEIQAYGQTYTYEVRSSSVIWPSQTWKVFQHEEFDWVTLITCEDFSPYSGNYIFRRIVQAVLIGIS